VNIMPFTADAVDVGVLYPIQPERVGADVRLADIVAPDDEDVMAAAPDGAAGCRLRLCT